MSYPNNNEDRVPPTSTDSQYRLLKRLMEGVFVLTVALAMYFTLALVSYDSNDPAWSTMGGNNEVENAAGEAGAWFSDVFFSLFGLAAFTIPLSLVYRVYLIFKNRHALDLDDWPSLLINFIGMMLVILAITGMCAINTPIEASIYPFGNGGMLGEKLAIEFLQSFGLTGGRLAFITLFVIGLTLFSDISWLLFFERVGEFTCDIAEKHLPAMINRFKNRRELHAQEKEEKVKTLERVAERKEALEEEIVKQKTRIPPKIKLPEVTQSAEPSLKAIKEKQVELFQDTGDILPSLGLLLKAPDQGDKGYSPEMLEQMSRLLELKLKDFKIVAEVTDVYPGPVITRFEIKPAPGTKVSTISNLAKDIARSLAVISVRVVEVIQGKSVIGIEIPNEDREIVYFSQVVGSRAFEQSKSPLSLALGHDIAGQPVMADLAKMPHLLVAGTTGSGKSVGVNAMLLSLLFKATPEEVRLILVDPKMLELSVYEGIPHLLTPVITDMKDAAAGLRWCVAEMERRYMLMSKLGVRNVSGFNKKVSDAIKVGEPISDPLFNPDEHFQAGLDIATAPNLEPLPYIVVVIDEFADMMMIVGKKVEELIARIAQKARAAGIHLILATQRPSVDVITGLIKANVPTRMAFQVSSKIDSRTILDQGGAEQLLGHGDMLYMPPGSSMLTRVHGAFVDDDEVHRVVESWKERSQPNYIEGLIESGSANEIPGMASESSADDDNGEADALYDEAVAFVTETGKVSISSVQRKLRIGYNRAARMVETMEAGGVVSGANERGQREVLAPAPPSR